jgi:3-hydroxymyristoyl/3-hydroxydecanoyl-(acyl carrier protein) dehydratase
MRGGFLLEHLETLPRGWGARVRVPPDAPLFDGHFPGRPVVPGIALLLLIGDLAGEHGAQETVPVRLRGVRFRAPAGPGVVLAVRFEDGRFAVRESDAIVVDGEMELAPASAVLTLSESTPVLPPPFLPHAPPALLVTGVGDGHAVARVPARSPLARDGHVPACVVLEAAAQGAQPSGQPRGGLLVRVSEASFPAAHLPLETPFMLQVQEDGAAPPLHRFRARAELGGAPATIAFAVLGS